MPHVPPTSAVPCTLDRFVAAQEEHWEYVREELLAGKKRSHWMWFVFPQFRGLGHSRMAVRFAIQSRAEAVAYLAHPVLGARLREGCQILLGLPGSSAFEVFGSTDEVKLRSCMTLFDAVSVPGGVFEAVLLKYFGGEKDARTAELIACGVGDADGLAAN